MLFIDKQYQIVLHSRVHVACFLRLAYSNMCLLFITHHILEIASLDMPLEQLRRKTQQLKCTSGGRTTRVLCRAVQLIKLLPSLIVKTQKRKLDPPGPTLDGA